MLFFASKSDICNFADDNTLDDILHDLKFDLGHILKWVKVNLLKPNYGKFQFMLLRTNTDVKINLFLDEDKIEKSSEFVLLGIANDDV